MFRWIGVGLNAATNWWFAVTILFAGAVWGATFAFSLPWIGRVVLLVCLALLFVLLGIPAAVSAREFYRDAVRGYPRLVFTETRVIRRTIYTPQTGSLPTTAGTLPYPVASAVGGSGQNLEAADYVYAVVANAAQNKHKDTTANGALASLEITDIVGKRLVGPLNARWADSPNPAEQTLFSSPAEYDVWHVGADKPEPIDLVYKFLDEDCCYVYTNENARSGLRDGSTRVAERQFFVRLRLTSPNAISVDARFEVSHGGPGTVPTIRRIEA
jgi:hypothetical protein